VALRLAVLAVVALALGWAALQARRRRAGLCPGCGRQPPDAQLGDPYWTPLCSSCVKSQERGSRVALYVFTGFAVVLAGMAAFGIVDDIRRGYKYGLKDLPETAFALFLLLTPAIGLLVMSWRHLKAAEKARVDTNNTGRPAARSGGPTMR
jgi:hypothetical protein